MRLFVVALVVACSVLIAVATALIWIATGGAGAGDFTWRTQAILTHVQGAASMVWWLCLFGAVGGLLVNWNSPRRFNWGVGFVAAACIVGLSVYMRTQVEREIMGWHPNGPPAIWQDVRTAWFYMNGARAVSAAVLLVAVLVGPRQNVHRAQSPGEST